MSTVHCPESEPMLGTGSSSSGNPETISDRLDEPIALRKGVRTCTQNPISKFVSYDNLSPSFHAFTTNLSRIDVPRTIEDALAVPEWKNVVLEEMQALEKSDTWSLVELPQGKSVVECKWVFTIKVRPNGSIEIYKARLVAKGFTQTYGIDYTETFAPIAKLNTIRVLLSLAILKSDQESRIFTRQTDHTLLVKHSSNKRVTILVVYVDDIILIGDDFNEMEEIKRLMAMEFEIKDLRTMKYFLGMEVARSKKGISISQKKYPMDLLDETGMLSCKPIETPIEQGGKGKSFDEESVDKGRYQRLVGKLIYLSHTRPDIAFAVSQEKPGERTFFGKNEDRMVEVFTDPDWAGSVIDRKSTSGYCTQLWGNLVTWRSEKQSVVARSSAEAEYRAMAHGICEAIWIKQLLEELKISYEFPMQLYCDNKATICIAHNPVRHDRTKHVEVDRHFITEKLRRR
ncbi:Retrovirus-related Pol polyprotein from transposon TNT 1-94 [Vitis vinifera]|uniref:Retrovirus-related Pol polyprotein from transposon TNT 1-94 n=1 Tax=Vitis vinifera TaxID=29760 RepID=A0A438HPQ8_VITVI|nr:Retrovirus-related Pol polyprotein from transposon TNT 1-94 [Vitis vinifera]